MSRDILAGFDACGIAPATYENVGLPPVRMARGQRASRSGR